MIHLNRYKQLARHMPHAKHPFKGPQLHPGYVV